MCVCVCDSEGKKSSEEENKTHEVVTSRKCNTHIDTLT